MALVHSFYSSQQPSGENIQVEAERDALRRAGVDVALFAARTDVLELEPAYAVRTALRVATHHGSSPLDALNAFDPDVVHVHNLFPNYGRTWVRQVRTPVVATLHNFRVVCANGCLARDDRPCTECVDGGRWSALRHRCYRGSLAATLPVVIGQRRGPGSDPLLRRADRILCLSARHRDLLLADGVPGSRLVDWVNFLPTALDPGESGAAGTGRDGCLVVSRLTPEKGVAELVDAWAGDTVLTVVGDGPLLDDVRRAARGRAVEMAGRLPRQAVIELMTRSAALVTPGSFREVSAPLGYLEALACGLPVVARSTTDVADRIRETGTGSVVDRLADVPAAVAALAADPFASARCRAAFEARYTEAAWRTRILDLYAGLCRRPSPDSAEHLPH